ncbi:MAG: outer membrane beta-barrel protein [Verrucomicrobiales bacterium]|jgi:opacity protein-like surface antigen|nr:outer membrane beta-barrel protein [Verrucomicrobiales bacterium]
MKATITCIQLAIGVIALSGNLMAQTEPSAAMKQWGNYPYLKTGAPRPITLGTAENVSATPDVATPVQPQNAQPQVAFRTTATTRKPAYIAASLGVNAAQQDDNNNGAGSSLQSGAGYASSVRGGYTWQLGNGPDNLLALSLEGELLYTWNPNVKFIPVYPNHGLVHECYEAKSEKRDLHIWTLLVSPVLRFQLNKFVPYVGVGVGGALAVASAPLSENGNWSDSSNWWYSMAFAFQGMAGFDYYFNESWSIFAEYKYLGLIGLEFNNRLDGKTVDDPYKSDGILSNHIVSVGARFHF